MPRFINTSDMSFYDLPDDVGNTLGIHRVAGAPPPPGLPKDVLDLYRFEYEKGAQRYNDVYTAAWTNFSYMAIVAGAILTFGGDRFLPELSALLACIPLLFWWLATFEPLNRYGDQVIDRLSKIETILNTKYSLPPGEELCHFTNFSNREGELRQLPQGKAQWWPKAKCNKLRWRTAMIIFLLLFLLALKVFKIWQFDATISIAVSLLMLATLVIGLSLDYSKCGRTWKSIRSQWRRVRFVVRCFFFLLLIVALCLGIKIIKDSKPLLVQKDSAVKVIPVDFNDNLGVKLDGITAQQAKELLEKVEQQKAAQQPTK